MLASCILITVLNIITSVFGNYPCLCSYTLESPVYKSRNVTAPVIGYMYEFECKPTYDISDSGGSDFFSVQFEQQIGYVENKPGYFAIESCDGSPSSTDLVKTVVLTTHTGTAMYASTTQLPKTTTKTTTFSRTTSSPVASIPTSTTSTPTTSTSTPTTSTSTPTTSTSTSTTTTSTPTTTTSTPTTTTSTPTTTTSTPTTSTSTPTTSTSTPTSTTSTPTTTTSTPTTSSSTRTTTHSTPTTSTSTRTTTNSTPTTTTSTPTTTTSTPTTTTSTPTTTTSSPTTTVSIPISTMTSTTSTSTTTSTKAPVPTTTFDTGTHEWTCPNNWMKNQRHCYFFNMHDLLTYENASNRCLQDRAHLVFINSLQEQEWIAKQLHTYHNYRNGDDTHDGRRDTAVWIGAKYIPTRWYWVDEIANTNTTLDFTHWSLRHPAENHTHIRCAAIVGSIDSYWLDVICKQSNHYICERKANPVLPQQISTQQPSATTQHHDSGCPSGWARNNNSCYLVELKEHLTHGQAKRVCVKSGAHLVFINSKEEQTFLANILFRHDEHTVWLGGYNEGHANSTWYWTNGYTPGHHMHIAMQYTNWVGGSPQDQIHNGHDSCVVLDQRHHYKWGITNCDANSSYICELELTPAVTLIG